MKTGDLAVWQRAANFILLTTGVTAGAPCEMIFLSSLESPGP